MQAVPFVCLSAVRLYYIIGAYNGFTAYNVLLAARYVFELLVVELFKLIIV